MSHNIQSMTFINVQNIRIFYLWEYPKYLKYYWKLVKTKVTSVKCVMQ